jgi:hypothetical protein
VKDFLLLKSLVAGRLDRSTPAMTKLLAEFMSLQKDADLPYSGLLVLDDDKRVVDAVLLENGTVQESLVGSSYGGIEFKGPPKSLHRVLVLYRTDAANPMGARGLELAFRIASPAGSGGWLVFQMDEEQLKNTYNVSAQDLTEMVF